MKQTTFGIIVGTRGFFNSKLALQGRKDLLEVLRKKGYDYVILPQDATPTGAIETLDDARKCAKLFQEQRDKIDGIIVSLPNFGDELAVANAIHLAELKVPVLVQACDDELNKVDVAHRRDSFCGKLSVCNNLKQYGIPFTDTTTHTCDIKGKTFASDIDNFAGVCRVANGLRKARIGAIGARPAAFQTVRISEKLLQKSGITMVTVDLSEIMGAAEKMDTKSKFVQARLQEIRDYGKISKKITPDKLMKHARLSLALENWMKQNEIDAAGVLCWQSIQFNYGCAACLSMSMLSNKLIPMACEVDMGGALAMYGLVLASGNAPALIDWNNNYGEQRNKCIAQHCSAYAKDFIKNPITIGHLEIMSNNIGEDPCSGAIHGKAAAGPFSYFRVSTDDVNGKIRAYVGNAKFTNDPFNMNGGIAVCDIPNMQNLFKYLCKNGFEHHVAMARGHSAAIITEALQTYLGWDVYNHQ